MLSSLAPAPVGTVRCVADHDGMLVDRLAAGDDDALKELFDRYSGFVLGLARRVTHNEQVAEEVVQDVFASIWAKPQRFNASRGSLRAYLGVLTYSRAVDVVRSDVRRRAREARCVAEDADLRSKVDPLDATLTVEAVRNANACMPDGQGPAGTRARGGVRGPHARAIGRRAGVDQRHRGVPARGDEPRRAPRIVVG